MTDISFMRTFIAIYRHGSVTKAARALHMTQPAISQHLKALEAQLGRPLFHRHARGVRPTALGHELARAVGPHVDALEALAVSLRPGNVELSGTVHIGGPIDLLATRVLPALSTLTGRGLRFVIRPGLVAELLQSVAVGEIDLLVAAEYRPGFDLTFEKLFDEEFSLVSAPHFAARLPPVSEPKARADALAQGPFVAFNEDMPIVRQYFREVMGVELEGRAHVVFPDLRGVCSAVAAGLGVGVPPRHLTREYLERGELVELYEGAPPIRNTVHLASRAGSLRLARNAAVRNALVRAAASWSQPGGVAVHPAG